MAKKLYDLAVKVGEYTTCEGVTKGRWQNIGSVMSNDDGGKFLLIDRIFNPAGLPNPDDRSNVLVSMFKPREYDDRQAASPPAAPPKPAAMPPTPEDDDIPF